MPKLLSVIGVLVVCAGLDLLWQSRRELRFWASTYFNVFRAMLRFGEPERVVAIKAVAVTINEILRRQTAQQFLLGMGLALVLGPTLIAIGITLTFYVHL
ncbi:MAG TPA: hypothetical protein VMF66_17320 [Candidatus Acidoferrum sp.]|nr:hypothetical protein [Candidatus Acidoferrum sp.]